jgi:hypothetical protein
MNKQDWGWSQWWTTFLVHMRSWISSLDQTRTFLRLQFTEQHSHVVFAKRKWWVDAGLWVVAVRGCQAVAWGVIPSSKAPPWRSSYRLPAELEVGKGGQGKRGIEHQLRTYVPMGKIEPPNPEVKGTNRPLLAFTQVCITSGFCPVEGMVHWISGVSLPCLSRGLLGCLWLNSCSDHPGGCAHSATSRHLGESGEATWGLISELYCPCHCAWYPLVGGQDCRL